MKTNADMSTRLLSRLMNLVCLGFAIGLISGCASNPLLTGKPQDWQGHTVADLKAALGEPTKIIPNSKGDIWEYSRTGEFKQQAGENTSFSFGGHNGGSTFGASGGITTTKLEKEMKQEETIWRFCINEGKVKGWSASRYVDGRCVWEDH